MSRGEQARAEILDAAERLIAEQGVRVPLRDVAVAAGQRNNSAVNYHFRNRRALIHAVVERRLGPMERERASMLTALDDAAGLEVDALLRVLVTPLVSADSAYYARFLQAAVQYLPTEVDGTQGAVWPRVLNRLARAVPTTDPAGKRRRLAAVATAMFALLADWERTAHSAEAHTAPPDEIVAMLTAMILAPLPDP